MPVTRQQAVVNALRSTAYPVGMCARWTREQFGVTALGDFDGDGDADAVDMWKASVLKNHDDHNPPAGVPVFWSGGSKGHGHAAISLGGGMVRSTDAWTPGQVGTVPLSEVAPRWGMTYLGWTQDLYHHEIGDDLAEVRDLQRRIANKAARRRALKAQLKRLRDRLKSLRP